MNIRRFEPKDRALYLQMAQDFYQSPAVLQPIPRSYMERTFDEMMRSDVYVDGYLMETDDGAPMGYVLIAKTFSQEPGGLAVWVEELSVLPEYRGQGAGTQALEWVKKRYPNCKRIRLEVELENTRAIALYERLGFQEFPYFQMVIDAE